MAFQGIDIRQTGDRIVFRASLKDSTGADLTSGTTNLRLYELQNDGTLKSYDWNSNTFKTTALTTEDQALTHRTGNNSTSNTGLWTFALTTLTGFTAGNLYIAKVKNTGASPVAQEREFQFGVSSAFDPYDAVRAGLTALPNANAEAAGGLYTRGTGAGQIKQTNNGEIDANATRVAGTAQTAGDIIARLPAALDANGFMKADVEDWKGSTAPAMTGDAFARLGAPAGASTAADVAAIKAVLPTALTSGGRMKASVEAILDTTFTEGAAGRIAAAFKQFFNIASPAATMDHGILVDTATNLTNAPTAGDLTATMKASVTTAATAATPTAAAVTAPVALTSAYDAAKTAAQEPQGIKKNTALAAFTFPIFDPSDHLTPKTGLSVTATRSLDGAAFVACANAVSEIGTTGYYKINLAAADLNGEIVVLSFTASGGDPQSVTIRTVT